MKKRTKPITELLLVFMLLISIVACGSKEVTDGNVISETKVEAVEEPSSDSAQEVVEAEVEEVMESNVEEDFTTTTEETSNGSEEVYLLTEKKYYIKDGIFWSGEKYEYNQAGTLIKTSGMDNTLAENVIQEAKTYENGALKENVRIDMSYGIRYYDFYDEAGRVVETYHMYDGYSNKNDHYTYEYNEAGQVSRMQSNGTVWVYEYNEHGDEVRNEMTNSGGSTVFSHKYEYDEADNKRIMERYEGEFLSSRDEYDEKGTLRTHISYHPGSDMPAATVYAIDEYDAEGRLTLRKSFDYFNPELPNSWIICEYSEDGKNKTVITCDSDGNPVDKQTSYANYVEEYDANGNLIRTLEYTGILIEINYNANGNKVNKIYYGVGEDL